MRAATDSTLRQALEGSLALLGDSQALSAQGSGAGRSSGAAPRAALRYGAPPRRTISSRASALEPFVQDRHVWGPPLAGLYPVLWLSARGMHNEAAVAQTEAGDTCP